MENQHRKITGYRELNPDEIAEMNQVKELGKTIGAAVARLQAMPQLDQRWVSDGALDLQTGLMKLTRGIARPDFF